MSFGVGDDVMVNSGSIAQDVVFGQGNNSLTNSGEIGRYVRLLAGNDTVTNTGHILGFTDLGGGNDKYQGGNFAEEVWDGDGADKYILGGGNDIYRSDMANPLLITGRDGAGDKVDGGANAVVDFAHNEFGDIYDAAGSDHSVFINADTVAHGPADDTALAVTLAKGTATGNEIGLDFISNFESFIGGNANDIFFGGSKAEYMNGDIGFDNLHGGAGNDYLYGWDDADRLWGDQGADVLTSGTGSDWFVFNSLKDSTVAKSGRDVIADYHDWEDSLEFHGADFVNFHLNSVIVNSAFDGTAGSLRILWNNEGWLLQYDKNGDRKADMSIQVNDASHATTWDNGDFLVS